MSARALAWALGACAGLSGCGLGEGKGHGPSDPKAALEGEADVRDGDTLVVSGTRVRLWGVDTPELDQVCHDGRREVRCGEAARRALRERVAGERLRCEPEGSDRYNRVVARCQVKRTGEDLGTFLVASGLAFAYRSITKAYVDEEERARREGRGLFAGAAEPPWEWRKKKRLKQAQGVDD